MISNPLVYHILEPDAPATHAKNNKEVNRQQAAEKMKVKIARELGEKKAAEKTIERTFFRNYMTLNFA
jgi:hypothetical protein